VTFSDGQPTWNSGRVWREPPERQRHLKFGRRGREGRRHIQRDPGRDAWNHLGMSGVDPGSKSALRSAQILMRSGKSVPDCAASSEPHGSRTPFTATDVRLFLRVACEVAPRCELVIQDVTNVINAGYYAEDEPICERAVRILTDRHPENSSRIILTEGSSDSEILAKAMEILYPHLSGYYSFLDFEGSKSQGGAGHLVAIVKAFAAAGISNRMIAVFDNDTAAAESLRSLDHVKLPSNISIQRYPDLEELSNYPTLGPAGLVHLDVNGLAASIELYLGDDILKDPSGTFTPVQWKGYSESMKRYQGEVMHKTRLKHAFFEKAAICKADPARVNLSDWRGLDAILRQIFSAFD